MCNLGCEPELKSILLAPIDRTSTGLYSNLDVKLEMSIKSVFIVLIQ
jgi:hypothetical protein